MKVYIAIHHHKHGVDLYPFFQEEEPTQEDVIPRIEAKASWEPEGPDWVEIRGPWTPENNWEPMEGFQELVEEVERYISPHDDSIQTSLDNLVDDIRSRDTSGINNEGPAGQLEYLVREAKMPLSEIRESLGLD